MKIISWNISGFRSVIKHGFEDFLKSQDADIYCFQEIKAKESQITLNLDGYERYIFSAKRPGYSGTMIYSKLKPLNVVYGIGDANYDDDGRNITLEFENFYLVNCYAPNSKQKLERLEDRLKFEDLIKTYLNNLLEKKNVIYCGDLNVSHQEIDLKYPKLKRRKPGFTDEERNKFTELLNSGFIDTFRKLHTDTVQYSCWSYLGNARKNNSGYRADYFVVNTSLFDKVQKSEILCDVMGSDHCPIKLELSMDS